MKSMVHGFAVGGALTMGLALTSGNAFATLIQFNFAGTIASSSASSSGSGNQTQTLAAQNARAKVPVGSAYSASFIVDLDSPYTPNSGVANFEGSIESFKFTDQSTGFTYSSTTQTHSGISIKSLSGGGDIVYFYLPTDLVAGSGISLKTTFFLEDPTGTLHTGSDLHEWYNTLDTTDYQKLGGQTFLNSSSCYMGGCGSFEFKITSVDVHTIPEPATAGLLATALAGLAVLARRRRR